MTELAVPAEDPGGTGAKSSTLVLSDDQRQLEAMIAASLALEFGRVEVLADSRSAAAYSASVVDKSRALSAGIARSHMSLLRGQLKWLRGLRPGSAELRWL